MRIDKHHRRQIKYSKLEILIFSHSKIIEKIHVLYIYINECMYGYIQSLLNKVLLREWFIILCYSLICSNLLLVSSDPKPLLKTSQTSLLNISGSSIKNSCTFYFIDQNYLRRIDKYTSLFYFYFFTYPQILNLKLKSVKAPS
jgi:hypothetical protein